MAEKASKAKKTQNKDKNIIIGICAAVVLVVIVIIAVVLATTNKKLDDSFFVSDGTKYVLTMDMDDASDEEGAPLKAHIVYFYSGDNVTGMKSYYEFADAAAAKAAYELYTAEEDGGSYSIDGKYIILTAEPSDYEGMTASDVKQQIDFMEMLKNMDTDEDTVDMVEENEE
ncbi:hypothetical protein IJF93_02650 [Candidatus Saccharibacteria bacterium]|nr:hypothetical protein [Candidatus Saccharibacteria bacterium]